MSVLEIFHQGGFIMWPLLIFSIIAWSLFLHKLISLHSFSKEYLKFDQNIQSAIQSGSEADIRAVIKTAPPTIARPHEVMMDDTFSSKEEMNDRLSRRLAETNTHLKSGLWMLGTIGSSAPFIGLFGTVMGIMESFKSIGTSGKSGFSIVAAGISESLIATAAGIIVAVIAVLFYNFFQVKVGHIFQGFRNKVEDSAEMVLLKRKAKK